VTLLGAGSHARALIALSIECGVKVDKIVDVNSFESTGEIINGIPVVAKGTKLAVKTPVILSIGDNAVRQKVYEKEQNVLDLVSPTANVNLDAEIGAANQIFANVFINTNVVIGENNIINTGVIIEHECTIGSHNHISIGTVLAGRVTIGDQCFLGANSTVIDKVNICSHVIIGAGSVVISDITEPGTYVGNPTRKIK
jgi:sugar O-acyltransferase (sialic acid O-acetyltransferase NeuD family)